MTPAALRLALLDRGYTPIPITSPDAPVKDAGKAPQLPRWQRIEVTADCIRAWERVRPDETNTGLRTGLLVASDIDVRDQSLTRAIWQLAQIRLGQTPLTRVGQSPKALCCYQAIHPLKKAKSTRLIMPDGQPALVEVLGHGQQFVAFGIHPVTRQPYRWGRVTPLDVPRVDLPVVSQESANDFVVAAEALLRAAGGVPEHKESRQSQEPRSRPTRPPSAWPAPSREEVADALAAVPNDSDWHRWVKIGASVYDALADDGEELFTAWSAKSTKHDAEYTRRKWKSFRTCPMTTRAATLFWYARENGWRPEGKCDAA